MVEANVFGEVEDERFQEIIDAMAEIDWKPNISAINDKTGTPVTTLWDRWRQMEEKYDVKLAISVRKKDKTQKEK